MTDLEDSVSLLKVTYPTLISLAKLWYPELPKRVYLLDKLVRDGVIYAMLFSSSEKLKVVQVELESLDLVIHEMGIYFVKHLKVRYPETFLIIAHHPNPVIHSRGSTGW